MAFDHVKAVLEDRRAPLYRAIMLVLAILAAISIGTAVERAQSGGKDMIWGPLVVFWQDHLDPYKELIIRPNHKLDIARHINPKSDVNALGQCNANLHSILFLLAPLAFMSFTAAKAVWTVANLLFLCGIAAILRRFVEGPWRLPIFLLFLCSASVRAVFINGQLSLFCLFWYTLYLVFSERRPILAALFAGIGTARYSLGVPLFFQMKITPATVVAFAALPLAAIVFWAGYFHMGLVDAALMPMRSTPFLMTPFDGEGDLLMLLRSLGSPDMVSNALILVLLVCGAYLQRRFLPTQNTVLLFGFYATFGLWLVYHRIHDFVFLLPAVIVSARSANAEVRYGIFAGVALIWFALSAVHAVLPLTAARSVVFADLLIIQSLLCWEMTTLDKRAYLTGLLRPPCAVC